MKPVFIYVSVILFIFLAIIMSSFMSSNLSSFGGTSSQASSWIGMIPSGVMVMFVVGFIVFFALFGMTKLRKG